MTTFVKFTLGDIQNSVRRKLDDTGFDAATITEAANDFQFELFNDNRIRFMEKNTTLAFALNEYTKPMPADFQTLINLTMVKSATQLFDLTDNYLDYDTFMNNYPNFAVSNVQQPNAFTYFGGDLRLSARSNGAYTMNMDYLRTPVIMVNTIDTCEVPIHFRELMTLGTLERVMRINEDYNESDEEVARLDRLRTAFVKQYGRGGVKVGPQIVKSNQRGQGRRAYRQGEDM